MNDKVSNGYAHTPNSKARNYYSDTAIITLGHINDNRAYENLLKNSVKS